MLYDSESGQHWTSASVENSRSTPKNWEAELSQMPSSWALTPVKEKRPLRPDWQHEPPIGRPELLQLLQKGQPLESSNGKIWHCYWTGVGLRLGKISGGLLAIDADGPLAEAKLQELSHGYLPKTPSWTSGKEGRRQLLYQIPSSNHDNLKTVKLDCGDGQYLEFRWDGCQSVLPPSLHPETGQYYWLTSPAESDVVLAPEWLLTFLAQQNQPRPIHTAKPYCPHLGQNFRRWTDIDWAQSYLASLNSYRADDYDQWVQVGMALHNVDETLLDDWEVWSQQSSKYKPGQCEAKWRSFKPGGNITIASLSYWAKEDGWQFPKKESPPGLWQSEQPPQSSPPSIPAKSSAPKRKEAMNFAQLRQAILTAIDNDAQGLQRTEIELKLSHDTGLSQRQIQGIWRQIEQEQEFQKDCAASLQTPLTKLLETRVERLDPHRLFDLSLAQNIIDCANAMPGPAEGIVVTMLAAAAGCAGTHAEVVVKRSAGYTQPCLLRTLLVGDSGQLKSPLQKVALAPLQRLEQESLQKYTEVVKAYQANLAKIEKGQEIPDSPLRQRYLLVDTTPEKLIKIHAESKQGFLIHRDEWGGHIKSFNKYRNGVGDDREIDLSEFNGGALIRDRVGDSSIFINKSAVSRTGGVQPVVLTELANKGEDADGFFARWLVCNPPYPSPYKNFIDDEGNQTEQLQEKLYQIYKDLRNLPDCQYELEMSAKQNFQTWQHHLVNLSMREKQGHLKALYPKLEAYTARLALVLHLINAVSEGQTPASTISGETMMQAIYLAQYFLGQYQWVFAQQTTEGEGLTGMLAQIQTFAARHNRVITARDVKQMVSGIKKSSKATSSFIRTIFSQLASAGYGMVQGSGIHLTYKALQDWGQQNLQNLLSLPKPLLPEDLSLDKNVDNANLQKATSTKESWVPVKILLGDQYLETGQGRYMETGDFEVLLDKGLKVLIAPEQQHRIQQYHVQENEENVDVGRFVAPLANTVKSIQAEAPNENVDLLASTAIRTETEPQPAVIATSTPVDQAPIDELIPWHTFPLAEVKQETEVSPTPQAIAHEVRSQLLICQSPHHFHQLIAQFGQTIIDWVTEHLLSTQKRIFLTQHLA